MKSIRYLLPLMGCFAALALSPAPGEACIHGPKEFKGYVDSGAQRGLVFWDNGREELVIQPAYTVNTAALEADEFTDDGKLKNFDSFAWVLPLAALPDKYEEAAPEVFTDIDKFTEVVSRIPEPEKSDDEDSGPSLGYDEAEEDIEFFEALDVGDYNIQPIKAKGEAGGKELAGWLKDNGFGEVDERVLRFYLEHEYYWLAIKLKSEDGLPADGSAKPLHVSFKTPAPTYPWKIYDKRGEFDIELWVITRDAIDLTKSTRFGVETPEQIDDSRMQKNREPSYVELPETVRAIADGVDDLKNLRLAKVYVYRFIGKNIEAEDGLDLSLLQDEMFFEFEKDIAPKPKEEVKPTKPEDEKKDGDKGKEGEDKEGKDQPEK
ncbi:MAG: DUF2330 domain-containing protein [Planctomycetes bacterium]|nr:DUF2330 domain-containing protein [Planctomycetota bacterium]